MKKFVPFLALALILGFAADLRGQNITATNVTTGTVTLPASDAVPQVTSFFGSSAIFGTTPYYYWFVSRTGSNVSPPAGPLVVQAPASLSSLNNISISWTPIAGPVTSYDVLRTATSATPSGACNCAVAQGATLTKLTDSGAALQSYTVSAVGSNWTIQSLVNGGVQALMGFYQGTGYQIAPNSGGGSGSANQTVSPLSFGAKWDVKYVYDASYTASNATITCPNSDCNFSPSDIGKIVMGFESPWSVNNPLTIYATLISCPSSCPTISSLNSANSINISSSAAVLNSCTPSASNTNVCTLAWGTQDDTTAINNAMVAAWETAGAPCKALVFPSGAAFFSAPIVNATLATLNSACGGQQGTTGGIDTTQTGPVVWGQGEGATTLIPLPYFNFSACTFGFSGVGCNFATPSIVAHDFAINGLGNSVPSPHTVDLVEIDGSNGGQTCTGSTGYNLSFANWAVQSAGSIGLSAGQDGCSNEYYWNNIVELFGASAAQFFAQQQTIVQGNAFLGFTANGWILQPGNLGQINTSANYVLQGIPTGGTLDYVNFPACSGGTCFWNSTGDYLLESLGGTFGMNGVILQNGAGHQVVNMSKTLLTIGPSATATSQAFALVNSTGGSNVHVDHSTITATGPNNRMLDTVAGNNFFDDGGNTFTQGSLANAIAGGYVGPPMPAIQSFTNATIASNISVTANTVTTLMTATPALPVSAGSYRATINYSVYIVGGTIGMSWLSDGTHTGGMSYCGTVSNNFSFCSGSWTTPVQYTGSNPTFTLLFIDSGTATACSSILSGGSCGAVSGLSNIVNVPASMQISLIQSN